MEGGQMGKTKDKAFREDMDGWGHGGGREMGNNQFEELTKRSHCGECGGRGHTTRRCTNPKKKSNNYSRSSQPSSSQQGMAASKPNQPTSEWVEDKDAVGEEQGLWEWAAKKLRE
ncbi:hypothetical protein D1007_21021 [Hordeum vulgare]|nr:hypothetical protein D1007_21021 [Hordeum vulgare]